MVFFKAKCHELVDRIWVRDLDLIDEARHVTIVRFVKAAQNREKIAGGDFH
jgi:hypothetical protein